MKNRTTFSALILGLLLSSRAASAQTLPEHANAPGVIPAPREYVPSSHYFKLTAQTRIVLGERMTGEDRFAAQQLNTTLASMGKQSLRIVDQKELRRLPKNLLYLASPHSTFGRQWLKSKRLEFSPAMKDEGYILDVGQEEVVILAETPRGRFYGMMTLLQLLEQQKKSLLLPGCTIRDWPLQSIRGITDDLSRGQISTMENFKKIIRFLARHKLNVYSPYIEDIFVFKNHPLLAKGRGDLTATEVRELDAYAKQHHVELIPIFETLGHWENILVRPEYVKYAEFPGAHTVNVSDEAVYGMLDEMIGELCGAFSSPWFNMAADESWDVGLGANKARVAASDLATVHAEHYKRLFSIIRKYKKKPMMYGDVILNNPTILDKIPKDVVIVDWHYGAQEQYASPAVFKAAGFPFVVSPAVWNFTGPFPNYINTMVNIQNLNRDGYKNGSLGLLTSNWNDNGGEALRELNYYGYAWTAECAWNPLRADAVRFDSVFFPQFFGESGALPGQSAYALLSNPVNLVNWQELWRHPMLPLRQGAVPVPAVVRQQSILTTMPAALKAIDELAGTARENKDQTRSLAFVARLTQWFGNKLAAADDLKRAVQDTVVAGRKESIASAVAEARQVVTDLAGLRDEFKSLWLETNRSAGLDLLMMRYNRQIQYWEETIRSVEETGTIADPLIESQWIYHAQANPGRRDSSLSQAPQAVFRKTFSLGQPPSDAKVQLIADTRAKLWVNGVEVGEVYARRSLSLMVEHQRVKLWNITSLLKPGENVLAVEAANYNSFGSAGVNLLAEVRTGSTVMKIASDASWKAALQPQEGWKSAAFDETGWGNASPKPYPFQVVGPNFDTGRLSWIER